MEQDRADQATFGTTGVETTATSVPPRRTPGAAQSVFLASIGAVATALDEAEAAYDRFVDRGVRAQEEWRERAEDVRAQNVTARYRLRDTFRSAMDALLDTVNIPNKGDVDTINVKLNILTRKIDDLQIRTGRETAPDVATPPPPGTTDLAT